MRKTYEQVLIERLRSQYPTNTLQFYITRLGDNFSSGCMDNYFFNDSETQRNYGYYLVIKNTEYQTNYAMPYYPGISFPILTSLIDSLIMEEPETMLDFSDKFDEIPEDEEEIR